MQTRGYCSLPSAIGLVVVFAACADDPQAPVLGDSQSAAPLAHSAAAAPAWSELSPTGTPPVPRYSAGQAYDDINDRLIIFSGDDDVTPAPPRRQDVWVLMNATGVGATPSWVELFPTGGPPLGRFGGTVLYDPTSNRIIVHGGCSANCGSALQDTWVLTNANGSGGSPNWQQLVGAPVGRAEHSAVYDPASNRMIVFGGHTASFGTDRNDVWVLSDANGLGSPAWTQLFPTGTPPSGRREASVAYDQASNRLILFGGLEPPYAPEDFLNDLWALTNANGLGGAPQWIQLSASGSAPTRLAGASAYDPATNRMIVFGGTDASTNFNDVWVLAEANGIGGTPQWIPLAPSGGPPPARHLASSGYSTAGNRLIVTLGRTTTPVPNDLWVLSNANGLAGPYDFTGFFSPVDNPGTNEDVANRAKAGSGIPVKFSLAGDQGLDIFEPGYPRFVSTPCDNSDTQNAIEETTTSPAGLTYDPATDQYTYVWKSQKAWAGRCGAFQLGLNDGSDHHALFRFVR